MAKVVRKRRTREHVIADLSVNHVERHVLGCGYVVERMIHDYGVDLKLLTFDKAGYVEEGLVPIQLKASDRVTVRPQQATFPFRVERKDLARWLAEPFPVLLIVYRARKDIAHWLYVQRYFAKIEGFNLFSAGKTVTVQVPVRNVVDQAAIRRFARFRDRILDQMRKVVNHGEN
jgi:hypothetical protein